MIPTLIGFAIAFAFTVGSMWLSRRLGMWSGPISPITTYRLAERPQRLGMWLALLFLPLYLLAIALGLRSLSYLVIALALMTAGCLYMMTQRWVGTRANPRWAGAGFIELGVAFLLLAGATAIDVRHHPALNVIFVVLEGLAFFAAAFAFVMAYRRSSSRSRRA